MKDSKKYVVGNWKMHGTPGMARALTEAVVTHGKQVSLAVKIVLCPPVILMSEVRECLVGSALALGAQDCGVAVQGAYTGDTSAPMLKEAGVSHVIVGHSERRQYYGESNETVRKKAMAAVAAGLLPIVCVGESLAERQSGKAEEIVARQVKESLPPSGDFILAYEPVWAIGSGQTATKDDIRKMHAHIRLLASGRDVIYGGSVNPANAKEILSIDGVSGVLVGGASLKAEEFNKIIDAAK